MVRRTGPMLAGGQVADAHDVRRITLGLPRMPVALASEAWPRAASSPRDSPPSGTYRARSSSPGASAENVAVTVGRSQLEPERPVEVAGDVSGGPRGQVHEPRALVSGQIEQAPHERGADVLAASCRVDGRLLGVTALTGRPCDTVTKLMARQ